MKSIIIDGRDKIGKTTVIKLLSEKLDLPIVKMPRPDMNYIEEYSRFFNEVIVQYSKYPVIFDRGFTSSIVYSKVFERAVDLSYLVDVEDRLDAHVIILTGRHIVGGLPSYIAFGKDDLFGDADQVKIDKEFCKLGYPLVEVAGKTSMQIMNEILTLV